MAEAKLTEKRFTSENEKELITEFDIDYDFSFDRNSDKETFSIDNPPPYPSGDPHPGQLAHYCKIDMIGRTARMQGYNVLFPIGLDRNGINLELLVEKKHKKSIHDMDREFFVKECVIEMNKIGTSIIDIFKRSGMSFDFKNAYATDSDDYRAFSQAMFIEMWHRGQIVEHLRPNFYCPGCRTTIAEAEIVYEELPSKMNTIKFKVTETNDEIEIGTTRPELLVACKAILVHPDDERYKYLHGKHAIVPLYGTEVPIYAHTYAKPEFGTGIVMICSYGDTSDVQIFRELSLEPVQGIGEDGLMTQATGFLKGLTVKEARKTIIEKLKHEDLLVKQEDMTHRTPTCERSKDPLEFVSMKEWYIKQLEFLDDVRKKADAMTFLPAKNKQILTDWINSITIDWPISRRRYYHTEIPLWYCKDNHHPMLPEPGPYYRPWKDKAPFTKCTECGCTEFIGEDKVFDTWVDSSLSSLYISGFSRDDELFKKAFPVSIRPQGPEIVRTWLYYTILRNLQLLNEAPFKKVWIDGLGLAEDGKKMSKSAGNYLEINPILEKYGADAWRLWAASESNVGEFFRISEDRINGAAKFITKLWNLSKLISMFAQAEKPKELTGTDKWILEEFNNLVKESLKGYQDYNFFVPANRVREFVMNQFASHYVEMVKNRAYDNDASALYTLHYVLQGVLKLLAPITPFVTHKVYNELYSGLIHNETFPEYDAKTPQILSEKTQALMDFNSMIWKTKKEKGISLKAEITGIKIPEELELFKDDLVIMHNIK
ncbi:MAG: valine--tRNA ligase [DPANN group archaeon]|nr:valine--tRNA ligase [DPANN group archaeon]